MSRKLILIIFLRDSSTQQHNMTHSKMTHPFIMRVVIFQNLEEKEIWHEIEPYFCYYNDMQIRKNHTRRWLVYRI